jgi:transcriptional regulator with XRE-family HTH domain
MRGIKQPLSKDYEIRPDWFDKLIQETGITPIYLEKRFRISKQSIWQWRNRLHSPNAKMFMLLMKEFGLEPELFIRKVKRS